jgi:hypothetical protein
MKSPTKRTQWGSGQSTERTQWRSGCFARVRRAAGRRLWRPRTNPAPVPCPFVPEAPAVLPRVGPGCRRGPGFPERTQGPHPERTRGRTPNEPRPVPPGHPRGQQGAGASRRDQEPEVESPRRHRQTLPRGRRPIQSGTASPPGPQQSDPLPPGRRVAFGQRRGGGPDPGKVSATAASLTPYRLPGHTSAPGPPPRVPITRTYFPAPGSRPLYRSPGHTSHRRPRPDGRRTDYPDILPTPRGRPHLPGRTDYPDILRSPGGPHRRTDYPDILPRGGPSPPPDDRTDYPDIPRPGLPVPVEVSITDGPDILARRTPFLNG